MKIYLWLVLCAICTSSIAGESEYNTLLAQYEQLQELRISLENIEKIKGPNGDVGQTGIDGVKGETGLTGVRPTQAQFSELITNLQLREDWLINREQKTQSMVLMINELEQKINDLYNWANQIQWILDNE